MKEKKNKKAKGSQQLKQNLEPLRDNEVYMKDTNKE